MWDREKVLRTAMVCSSLKLCIPSWEKYQVYLTNGEKRVQVFPPVRLKQGSLQCCSGGCATLAAAADKASETVLTDLADHCTCISFLFRKFLLEASESLFSMSSWCLVVAPASQKQHLLPSRSLLSISLSPRSSNSHWFTAPKSLPSGT